MKSHELLGQVSGLHQMMTQLLESVPEADAYRSYQHGVPPLAWLYGRAAYAETYWLREVVQGDPDMTARVRELFAAGGEPDAALVQRLPPREHLLNWALELFDDNLMRLANPAMLPEHPLREDDRLLWRIAQLHARLYELMLVQLTERGLASDYDYRVGTPLAPSSPSTEHVDVHQGHFRIGAKADEPAAEDSELPTQVVELHAFRMDARPVSNAAYLGFIAAGGYDHRDWWDEAGRAWLDAHPHRPHHWRQDPDGRWYGVGLNGPFDLAAQDALSGISAHEAHAYAHWVASHGGELAGAVVQHEYQWEVAVRSGKVSHYGTVREWCANPFEPYTGYHAPDDREAASHGFGAGHRCLRGASLHSQTVLRRTSLRGHAHPGERHLFTGTRLVFPPSRMPWEKAEG